MAKYRKRKGKRAEKARKGAKSGTKLPLNEALPSDPVVTIAEEIAHQAAEMVDASIDD
jgi:hypothetical protein